ncbi:hypothetical protein [Longimicrobium sp.]|uniref:hypothetical protein n=1 Tax=Longimicrobium sp. TaxID=2029185 RepID=UPI002E31165A|nr:hypothetical protein [Longimicrobium sp.]HEX6042071.1 hypothetical protein [Longimicrobium sp.]
MTVTAPPSAVPTLVAHPGFTFGQMDHALAALGLAREPDAALTAPILPGEPELAAWRGDGGRIVYTFNPVVHLRVLAFHGPDAEGLRRAVAERVPQLGIGTAEALLSAGDPRQVLLGLLAAGEMRAAPLLPRIGPLRRHPHEVVRKAAEDVFRRLGGERAEAGLAEIAARHAAHPDRSTLFPLAGDAHARRQVVRWLMHDRVDADPHVVGVLRAALADADWEVRMSAVLAAACLDAREVGLEVRRAMLPDTGREGLSAWDRDVLRAARAAALDRLAGAAVPSAEAARGEGKAALRAHVARCVAGEPPARLDGIFLLLHALTAPVPPPEPPPPSLPPALEPTETEGRYRMADAGIELAWVPPVAHWLGDDPAHSPGAEPIRSVTHPIGFWIAVHPLEEDARRTLDAWRDRLGALSLAVPTADEWEMAARGPDARRFPWGNGVEEEMTARESPWGIVSATAVVSQWTLSADGKPMLRGGPDAPRCTARADVVSADSVGAMRPVLRP